MRYPNGMGSGCKTDISLQNQSGSGVADKIACAGHDREIEREPWDVDL